MKQTSLAAKAAFVAACVAAGSPSMAIDLLGSYDNAQRADPTMRAADEALLAGREKAQQGKALLRPQVSLSASVSRLHDRSSSDDLPAPLSALSQPDSSGTVSQVALQLKQPLYDAKARADKAQLQQQTVLAEINHHDARQDLMQRVAQAYFDLLLAQESLRVAQAEKSAMGLQRDRAQARFDVGRGKITDLQEAQARYDGVLTKEVSAQSTLALRQAQYQALTGVPGVGLAGLKPGFVPTPPQPESLPAWQLKAMDHNTQVLARHGALEIARAEIGKYRLAGRPTFDLVGSYTYKGQSGNLSPLVAPDGNRAAMLGVQFSVPLYAGGGLDSREREALAKQRQAESELQAAERDARLRVQDAFLSVHTGVSRIAAQQQAVLSARSALDATTLGRDVGSRTELDVLDAQQRLYATQLDLAQGQHDYLLARVRLAAAAGELGDADLSALNAHLEP